MQWVVVFAAAFIGLAVLIVALTGSQGQVWAAIQGSKAGQKYLGASPANASGGGSAGGSLDNSLAAPAPKGTPSSSQGGGMRRVAA